MKNFTSNPSINIKFSGLTFSVPKDKGNKSILKGVSGTFLSGEISAILGPSGAGKTTLMNILAGYKTTKTSGEILVNENPICMKSFRKQSCYIMQEEQLLPYLTVQESMEAAASLKLGNLKSKPLRNNLIDEILSTVGLAECKHTQVSNLSGGETKRLSIAFEILSKPPVMFLDEPTSGLDSQNSYQCITLLKKLAEEGRTVICTIHQPSTRLFEKFDYVYGLAEGHCVYRGSVPALLPFMSSISLQCPPCHNPAELLIEVSSGEHGNFIATLAAAVNRSLPLDGDKNNHSGKPIELDLVSDSKEQALVVSEDKNQNQSEMVYAPKGEINIDLSTTCCDKFLAPKLEENFLHYSVPFWTQFSILLVRTFRSILRDKMLTLFRFAVHVFIAVLCGMLYFNIGNEASEILSNVGYLYFSILFYIITAVIPTIITFPLETKVLVREHRNNWYSLKAYYLAKTLADTPFQVIFSLTFICIIYFMTSQSQEIVRFLMIAIIGILNTLISQSIGLIVGAALEIQFAVYAAPLSIIPPILISGIFIKISAIPSYLRWLTNISYLKYCYEASLRITYGYDRDPLDCSKEFCLFKYPKKVLQQFDVEENGLWLDILMLVIIFVVVRVLGYFTLRWKVRRRHD